MAEHGACFPSSTTVSIASTTSCVRKAGGVALLPTTTATRSTATRYTEKVRCLSWLAGRTISKDIHTKTISLRLESKVACT